MTIWDRVHRTDTWGTLDSLRKKGSQIAPICLSFVRLIEISCMLGWSFPTFPTESFSFSLFRDLVGMLFVLVSRQEALQLDHSSQFLSSQFASHGPIFLHFWTSVSMLLVNLKQYAYRMFKKKGNNLFCLANFSQRWSKITQIHRFWK